MDESKNIFLPSKNMRAEPSHSDLSQEREWTYFWQLQTTLFAAILCVNFIAYVSKIIKIASAFYTLVRKEAQKYQARAAYLIDFSFQSLSIMKHWAHRFNNPKQKSSTMKRCSEGSERNRRGIRFPAAVFARIADSDGWDSDTARGINIEKGGCNSHLFLCVSFISACHLVIHD